MHGLVSAPRARIAAMLGGGGLVPSFDLNFARLDNPVTKYGFSFTRATTATYVNSTGLIATAASGELRYTYDPVTLSALGVLIEEQRTNLVNRSEELNNGAFWNPVRTTPTPSATIGPNGVANSSCSILETAVTNTFHLDFSFTPAATTTYACSVFFKGGLGRGYATMDVTGGGGATGSCTINLTTGAVTAGSGTVQSYPNGWWRVSFTTTTVTTATLAMRLWCSNDGTASPSYAGDITKGIYAWGAQIEVGAFVTSYIPSISASATRNADVLSLTGAAGRTNLVQYSQAFDAATAYWGVVNGAAPTANTVQSPSGSIDAEDLVETAFAGSRLSCSRVSVSGGSTGAYTFSIYVKRRPGSLVRHVRLLLGDAALANYAQAFINVDTGALNSSSPSGASAPTGVSGGAQLLSDGWVRMWVTGTFSTTVTYVSLWSTDASYSTSYAGDTSSGFHVWGAQLETGASATTYIPTTNGPRTVGNVASWFNGDAGTFVIDSVVPQINASYNSALSINAGSNANQIYIYNNPTPRQYFETRSGSVTVASIHNGSALSPGSSVKFAAAYQVDDAVVYLNGTAGQTDTSAALPYSLKNVDINGGYSFGKWNGTIARLSYYPRRLDNATLQRLTT